MTKGRNVKSRTTDAHERVNDFLDPSEIARLLAAAKDGRYGARNHSTPDGRWVRMLDQRSA